MKHRTPEWNRLVVAARRAQADDRDTAAPYGFATRVVSQALTQVERPLSSLYERLSLRALCVASVLAVLSVAANFTSISRAMHEEPAQFNDPVSDLLEIS